ncbi:MAG: helix-turn-helix domain-containing protein [Roseomonas sp.]|nr:helix-turn-helix domain-containing protein [Roseomonas sp.]
MTDLLSPSDVERLAKQAGKTLKQVCETAGIAQSTFSRWKRGQTEPTLDVYRRIRDAVAPASPNADAVAHAAAQAARRDPADMPARHAATVAA